MNHPTIKSFISEFDRSVKKYGPLENYNVDQMRKAFLSELEEYSSARITGDVHGEHGQRIELTHIAVTAMKLSTLLAMER